MDVAGSAEITSAKPKSSISVLSVIYLCLAVLFLCIFVFSRIFEIPVEHFTADPAVTFTAHPLTGMASSIGILMWCVASVACLFSFALLKVTIQKTDYFLLFSGLLSLLLLFDDLFMLHEAIFPWYFHVPQYAIYAGYLLAILGYLLYFRNQILNSDYPILGIAVLLLGCSVIGDFILPQKGLAYLVEDGFKIFGIAAWMVYFCQLSFRSITGREKT